MQTRATLFLKFITAIVFLYLGGTPAWAQPSGEPGRSIVPGTHFVLTETDGGFTDAGATWIAGSGWRLIANEDAVRTPVFDLAHLSSSNLKWFARVRTPLASYVTFIEWYGNTQSDETNNSYYTSGGNVVETYSGIFGPTSTFNALSLDISKSWGGLNPPEPDYYSVFITEFWIEADNSVLPVRLAEFNAKKHENAVRLVWTTSSEENNDGFQIQRSSDGRNWRELGFVEARSASGSSSWETEYEYVDREPVKGMNLYRLKQIDHDGSYQLSSIRSVLLDEGAQAVLYPNPTSGFVTIDAMKGVQGLRITNALGMLVKEIEVTGETASFSMEGLAPGIYIVQTLSKGVVTASKMVSKVGR